MRITYMPIASASGDGTDANEQHRHTGDVHADERNHAASRSTSIDLGSSRISQPAPRVSSQLVELVQQARLRGAGF